MDVVVHRVQVVFDSFPEFMFFCPGCKCGHGFQTKGAGPCWEFNGDMERPTISPSILVRGHLGKSVVDGKDSYGVCHSFVRDGQIQFLPDCTHELAGQTVPLEAF